MLLSNPKSYKMARQACFMLQLFEWGLRPETAVGCALNFLFKLREDIIDLVRGNYEALQNAEALKIGIHVS